MLAVTSSNGKVSVVERDIPDGDGDGELIAITSSGICGSDLHMIENGLSNVILGHEFGGHTTDGRLVAVRPTRECGTCEHCRAHRSQVCSEVMSQGLGITVDGGLAEFMRVPADRLFEMPAGTDPANVGLVEPLAVVLHGINKMTLAAGSRALVVGAGSIGLLAAAVLRDRGVHVDIVARHSHQFHAAEQLGVRAVDTPARDYEASFDAVCTQQSFDTCISATRPGGALCEFGMFWTPVSLSNQMLLKEITVVPSMFYGHTNEHHDFEEAIEILARVPSIASTVVTHRFSLADAEEAFRVAADRKAGAIKVHLLTSL
jgi:threonine dehydrogenase-like Zn-dependent dehydrogenase